MSTDKNPPTLKGEVANNFYGVAVLPVQDHESEDDDDNIVPASPVQGRRSSWGRGLMKSARSSIEVRSNVFAADIITADSSSARKYRPADATLLTCDPLRGPM